MAMKSTKTSEIQKMKMLEFFERYPLLVTGTNLTPAKRKQAHKLWRELGVILNNCDPDGSKKTLRLWLKTLADLKSKCKKKVLAKERNISDFQRRLYQLAFGKSVNTGEKDSVDDTSMEIETLDEDNTDNQLDDDEEPEDDDEELEIERETKFKDTSEFTNGHTSEQEAMTAIDMENIKQDMEQNLEMQRQSLMVNRRTLEVQQRMLKSERELVDAVKQGVNVIQSVVKQHMHNVGNSNLIGSKNHNNLQSSKDSSQEENEFETFAKNISSQLQKLPIESALETQEVIQKILKEQRIKALQEKNQQQLLIRVLDDKFPRKNC